MDAIHAQRSGQVSNHTSKKRLLRELHSWERQLVLQSLNEAIRLMESKKVEKLTDRHLHAIAEYEAIRIDEEVFFDKAFTSGKEVAACLAFAMEIGWQEALDDFVRFRLTVTGPDASVAAATDSAHVDTSPPTPPQ